MHKRIRQPNLSSYFYFYFWVQQHPNRLYGTVHGYCSHSPWTVPDELNTYLQLPFFCLWVFVLFCFVFLFFFWVQKHPIPSLVPGTVHTAREQYKVSLIPMSVILFLLISLLISFCFFSLYSFFFFGVQKHPKKKLWG